MLKAKRKVVSLLTACLTMLFAFVLGFATLFAPTPVTTASAAEVVDVLDRTTTGVTETSYTSWSGKTATSSAVYAGQSAGDKDSIQLRSKNSNSGIVTTASGGKATKVVVVWNSGTTADRTLNIYGKNTAYSAPTDLYNTSTQGTQLGTIVKGTSTELVIDGDYGYIGMRSDSGAMYLTSISITWNDGNSTDEPACEHNYQSSPSDPYDGTHVSTCTLCGEVEEGTTPTTCSINEVENNGSKKVLTCDDCDYTYNQFLVTYNYPTNVTFNGEASTWVNEGASITLPTTDAPAGYVFAGWSETEISGSTKEKPTFFTDKNTVNTAKTLYAVYHKGEAGGWELVTDASTLASDDIVTFAVPSKNAAIGESSGTIFTKIDATFTDNILDDSDSLTRLTVTKTTVGTTSYFSFHTGTTYLAYTGSGNALHTNDTLEDNSRWTISITTTGNIPLATILNKKYTTRNLQYNIGSPRFACYDNSTQQDVTIYKYTEGEDLTYMTSFDGACMHPSTTTTTVDATCTEAGSTAEVCDNCGEPIGEITEIPATGHLNQTTATVDATCTEAGSITVTCDDCGETISTTPIEALGHDITGGTPVNNENGTHSTTGTCSRCGEEGETVTETCDFERAVDAPKYTCTACGYFYTVTEYTVDYVVPAGIPNVASVVVEENNVTILKSAEDKLGYTFVGWVESELTKDTAECPEEIFKAGSEYTVMENVTLYALYSYSTGSGNYVKVTETPADWSGTYLIVYEATHEDDTIPYIFDGSLATLDASNNYQEISITNNSISKIDGDGYHFVINAVTGGYSIQSASGKYIGRTSDSNELDESSSTVYTNTIALNDDGTVQITGSGNAVLRFNTAKDQERFRYYKSSTYSSQQPISLYALDGQTYYSTNFDCTSNITSANAEVNAEITLNYYVDLTDSLVANTTMQFVIGEDMYEVAPVEDGERFKFPLPLPPQYMATEIKATLLCDGKVADQFNNYSIKTYVQNLLTAHPDDTKLVDFLTAMLYYGDAAQAHQNYNLDNLATTGVTGMAEVTTPVISSEYDMVLEKTNVSGSAYFTGANVLFASINKLCVGISTTENVTLEINDVEVPVTGTTIYTEGILATEFGTPVKFELYQNGQLMQTLYYSIYTYAYKMNKYAETDPVRNLALALYRYGVAAAAYNA